VLLRLLRLFGPFRQLEAASEESLKVRKALIETRSQLQQERARLIGMQDRMIEIQSILVWFKQQLVRAGDAEREVTRAAANFGFQRLFGAAPFRESPAIPEQEIRAADLNPAPPRSILASDLTAGKSADAMRQLDAWLDKLKVPEHDRSGRSSPGSQ
jgi:hypothetical protein